MSTPLHSSLREQAENQPDKIALEYRTKRISYASLEAACRHFAGGCMHAGLAQGTRVGVYLPPCIEAVVAFFGVFNAGACLVPVNPAIKSGQVAHLLDDCSMELLVTTSSRLIALRETLVHSSCLHTVVLVDQDTFRSQDTDQAIHVEGWQEFCAHSDPACTEVRASDLAAIFYTSGSTGLPKGSC